MADKDVRVEAPTEEAPAVAPETAQEGLENTVAVAALDVANTADPAPTPTLDAVAEASPVEAATSRLALADAEVDALREAAASGDEAAVAAYNAAVAKQGADLALVLGGLSEEDRTTFLEGAGKDHVTDALRAAHESGDAETLKAVVASMVGASENLSAAELELMAAAVREVGLDALGPEVRAALTAGAGAKLAVELAWGSGQQLEDGDFALLLTEDLQRVDQQFSDSADAATRLRTQRAEAVARMSAAGLTADEIADWETDFDAQHADAMAGYEADAATYASTLEGRAHGQSKHGEQIPFSLENAGKLADTEVGGQAVAAALLRSGQGEDSWLDHLPGDLSDEDRERLVTQGAMQGVGALAATADIEGIQALLTGLEGNGGDAAAIAGLRERLGAIDPAGMDPQALRQSILGAFQPGEGASAEEKALLERLGISAEIGTAAGLASGIFGVLGEVSDAGGRPPPGSVSRLTTGLSAVSGLISLLQGGTQDLAALGLTASQFGFDVVSLLKEIPRGVGLGVGAAFSLVDAALHLRDGNYAKAGAALLPIIGMGIGAVLGGPLGAAIGMGIGSVANMVLSALGILEPSDEIAPLIEPALTEAMLARGASPDTARAMAEALALPSNGEKFTYVAATMGLTPEELLNQLATSPPGYARWFLDGMSSRVNFADEETPFQRTPDQSRGTDEWFETIWELSPEALADMDPRRAAQWMGNPLFTAQANARRTVNDQRS